VSTKNANNSDDAGISFSPEQDRVVLEKIAKKV
jgi:hypothetical protein